MWVKEFSKEQDDVLVPNNVVQDVCVHNKTDEVSYMERQKQLYANAYAPWTEEDDHNLVQLYQDGKSIKELMKIFAGNNGAIRSRIRKLGLEFLLLKIFCCYF